MNSLLDEQPGLYEQIESLDSLKVGDIVTHAATGDAYVLTYKSPSGFVGVRSLIVCNAPEWRKYIGPK